ncbi:tail fiber assembly protein [Escherichia phage tuntematon]|uniref:Tail fiber assembly protein n=3 Tax=Phapecoctavirus TaxID=2733124 RepID=A0A6B9X090_9CAUD|nr:tail fiber assembly protein [Escherichia phage anhysbys]YP_009986338.1 tail fiber assembly protein [Escherichia phage nieznany]YP_009986508.1 tail fiber assembly protein [Escherichia phage tuntematon]QHR69551.1 hypothetical protein nieznany_218 [Escherichia phage nieznany]QHR71988.1 hypothetical protein tuntematon_132 [Escherichia phage tuntematon]QHR76165.1 hypothetical protein anhysbys_269 [Escherichia phage anhysbys]
MNIVYDGFELYTPEPNEDTLFLIGLGVGFLRDSSGRDWYDLSKELDAKYPDAYFVSLNTDNLVLGVGEDAVGLFPHNMRVVVTDSVPKGMTEYPRQWRYNGTTFEKHNTWTQEDVDTTLETELTWAGNQIGALTDLQELQGLSEEQEKWLKAVKLYRASLVLLDLKDLNNIQWPDRPTQ